VLRVLCFLFALPILVIVRSAHGHAALGSSGTYLVEGRQAKGELVADPSQLVLDRAVEVRSEHALCTFRALKVTDEGPMVRIAWKAECDAPVHTIRLPWLPKEGHTHIASIRTDAQTIEHSITSPTENVYQRSASGSLVWLGLKHILTGWDHLLFILALLLVPSSKRNLALTLSAFTIGHAISLLLLNQVAVPARVVESTIAVTIALAGLAAIRPNQSALTWRAALTLPIGVLHGLGFATALQGALQERTVWATLSFNVGIELGQFAFALVSIPCLAMADASPVFRVHGRRTLGFALVLAGNALAVFRAVVS
jgi:hydrogenase/urease accessory protein HupE